MAKGKSTQRAVPKLRGDTCWEKSKFQQSNIEEQSLFAGQLSKVKRKGQRRGTPSEVRLVGSRRAACEAPWQRWRTTRA